LRYEESRAREEGEARHQGTISRTLYKERKQYAKEFLEFLNTRHGNGAIKSMQLVDLAMEDVEAYNRMLVAAEYSASLVSKRLQFVHSIIKRAGRPEHDSQILGWNWDSRDVLHGKRADKRKLPSLSQLQSILRTCSAREHAMVWLAIGCGFGQRDLAAINVGQLDRQRYDLRRGKTGIDRYGETPPMVWNVVNAYLKTSPRQNGELLFVTRKGQPLVHGNTDSVSQWWKKLRTAMGKGGESLSGFYVLRHLGATEFGSRAGCSIGEMKRWLGHSASSQVADVYMRPVSPEYRPIVEWVGKALKSGKANIALKATRKN
jgi:integrase